MAVVRPFEPAADYEELFELLAELRGATAAQLHDLYFRRHSRSTTVTLRAVRDRLNRLVEHGYLTRFGLPDSHQQLIHLTEKGRTQFPAVAAAYGDQVRKVPSVDVATWAWQRSALWACLVADGWNVGGGLPALLALRRHLLDHLSASVARSRDAAMAEIRRAPELAPAFVWRCGGCDWQSTRDVRQPAKCPMCAASPLKQVPIEHIWRCTKCGVTATGPTSDAHGSCPGRFRRQRYLRFDVAFQKRAGAPPDVMLLLVDNPLRSIESQLMDLPLRFLDQPKLKVIIRPSDDDTIYDANSGTWATKGRRFRALLDAFSPHDNPRLYPFWVSAEVITYRPEVVLRTTTRRRHAPF